MNYKCFIQYKYRKNTSTGSGWSSTSTTIQPLTSQSETIIMQKLREKHKDCEIQLIKIEWK